MTTLQIIAGFWRDFGGQPLYETGFSDAARQSGAASPDDVNELIGSLSYLQGYADCAKLACPYMGIHWRIAHALGCHAAIFRTRLIRDRDGECPFKPEHAESLVHTFAVELTRLTEEKRELGAA